MNQFSEQTENTPPNICKIKLTYVYQVFASS